MRPVCGALLTPGLLPMNPNSIASSQIIAVPIRAGLLFGCLGAVAWGTGAPFIFPSLGPTAFLLSIRPQGHNARRAWAVIGGHAWGVAAGLASYHLLLSGASLMDLQAPGTWVGLGLAASGTVATALTSALMIGTRSVHPPACATTLIVSLGLLSTPTEGAVIVGAVTTLYALGAASSRLRFTS
jgi:CBS-domain-containing membrane protein